MAAELVFYGENSNGVGGDLETSTAIAASMVGAAGMSPLPIDLKGKTFPDEDEEQSRERVIRALRGRRHAAPEPHGRRQLDGRSARGDPRRPAQARVSPPSSSAQAFVTAYNLIVANRDKVEAVADAVIEKKEIYGDDLVRLLDAQEFVKPEIDWTAEESWPNLMNWSKDRTARTAITTSTVGGCSVSD